MNSFYASKKDGWIMAVLLGVIGAALVVMISAPFSGERPLVIVLEELLLGLMIAFSVSLWRNTNYTLSDEALLVRAGPIRERIPLAAIRSVEPSRALWSGAALSLDRLHVSYDGSRFGTYISPADRRAFLHDLAARAPTLIFEIDRVSRRRHDWGGAKGGNPSLDE